MSSFKGKKILDFGAGKGEMIEILAKMGAEVYAVEPFGYEYIRNKGFTVFKGLDDIPKDLRFDGIFSSNVIEHLYDPWNVLAALNEILDNNGWLFVTTPNAEGLNARLMRSRWREAAKPGHVTFFSPSSTPDLLRKVGFERVYRPVIHIDYNPGIYKRLFHNLLQILRLEGELKYLAWKTAPKTY